MCITGDFIYWLWVSAGQMMLLLSQLNTLLLIIHLLPAVFSHVLEEGLGGDTGDPGAEPGREPDAVAKEQKRSTINNAMEMDKKGGASQEIARLEEFLVKSWQELDRMLLWDMNNTKWCNGFYIEFTQSFAKETYSYDEHLKS